LVRVMLQRFLLRRRRLLQNPFFLGGILVCCLGLANWLVGSVKIGQYERLAALTATPEGEGVTLSSGFTFYNVSESHERHNIAVAKVQYYSVVLTAGEFLVFAGLTLLLVAYVRVRGSFPSPQNKTLLDRE
jgi:hypothetical protein